MRATVRSRCQHFLHARHIHATHRFRCETYDTYVHFNIFSFRLKVETNLRAWRVLPTQTTRAANSNGKRQGPWPAESCWVAEWDARSTRFPQQLQLLFESIEDRGPSEILWVLYVKKSVFRGDIWRRCTCNVFFFAVAVCECRRYWSPSRRVRGATAAAFQLSKTKVHKCFKSEVNSK